MIGDDPDSSVVISRFEFGAVYGRARGGCELAREVRWSGKRVSRNPVGLGMVKGGKGNAATTNGCKLYENMQMQCA